MMRLSFIFAGLTALAGCAGVTAPLGTALGIAPAAQAAPVVPANAPLIEVRLPDLGASGVFGLVARHAGVASFSTTDGVTLAYRNGVLTGTRGLSGDLIGADVTGTLARLAGAGRGGHARLHSYIDGENQVVLRGMRCQAREAGAAPVVAGGRQQVARRIDETCALQGQTLRNSYWIAGNGVVVKSRQWAGPVIGYVETTGAAR